MSGVRIISIIKKATIPIILLGIGPFFFLGGPPPTSHPIYPALWNLGHIFFFGLFTSWAAFRTPSLSPNSGWLPFVLFNFGILILGLGIEWAQNGFGRTPDWQDIWRNHLGVWLVLFWRAPYFKAKMPIKALCVGLLAWELIQIGLVGKSHIEIQNQLPIISELEKPKDVQCWKGDVCLSEQHAFFGRASLRVQLTTAQFSGASLQKLPWDWRRFNWLVFYVFNPEKEPLEFALRISDSKYNQHYSDRFTRSLCANPGWNEIRIPLLQVRQAPSGREMDMARIFNLAVVTSNLISPQTIYLDHFYLE